MRCLLPCIPSPTQSQIKDNIGIGNFAHASDLEIFREAARLGGAEDFIERLPDGFDTYFERPVKDHYSNLPGRTVDYSELRDVAGMSTGELSKGLSSRESLCEFFFPVFCFALYSFCRSRTFMRFLVSESNVGLLLFDEPSASLDQLSMVNSTPFALVCFFIFIYLSIQQIYSRAFAN